MNKFKFYFILFTSVLVLFSCNKSDSNDPIPLRDYAEQYATDMAIIEDYLNTYHIDVTNSTGADDQNVTFVKADETHPSMMSLLNSATFPKLLFKEIELDDITYKLYYIKLREDNPNGMSPVRVDQVMTAYRGTYLSYETDDDDVTTLKVKQFDYNPFPTEFFSLTAVVRGWTEIFPLFSDGEIINTPGQPTSYANFGAGIIFIPSGLGYYNMARVDLPSYSPLVFTFKLYDVKRADQDGDGVLSVDEDTNHNGIFTDDDTDGDGIKDFLDIDDDGDGYYTKTEIKNPATGLPFPTDQIPVCSSGKKNYLDKTCHPE